MYGTIAAVETFVDVHYQQQIDHLQVTAAPKACCLCCCAAKPTNSTTATKPLRLQVRTPLGSCACGVWWSDRDQRLRWSWPGAFSGAASRKSMPSCCAIFSRAFSNKLRTEPEMARRYEWGLERVIIDTLSQSTLSDCVTTEALQPLVEPVVNRFKFKPLEAPLVPNAPNSVFQLHMAL